MRVIIAAAGTGGHINPGIAIANKIKEEEPSAEILFIGTKKGLENDLVPRANYQLKTIDSYGISRSLNPKNIVKLIKTIKSIGEAKEIIKEFKPDLVVGTGGYICISVCLAAQKLNIPYVIHESNVLPGVSTKLLAKKARKILVGFEEAKKKINKNANVVTTGTPTKVKDLNFSDEEKDVLKQKEGFNKDIPLVLVFGGSQGAQSINSSMVKIINSKPEYQILWAVGPKQYDKIKEEIKIDNMEGIKVLPYIYNMEEMLNIADLVVCRSGAMTVTELEKVGKPAIFIPFPYAAENHQEYNARLLERNGSATVILDRELNEKILDEQIKALIKDKSVLKSMGNISKKLSIDNVEENIYKELKNILLERK